MIMNLDLYNYFYYVCEFKSVTKAANYLYISQPAITKQIRNLEKRLGKKLIEKDSKGIILTRDGELLFKQIKNSIEVLNNVEAIFKEKSDKYNQTIRVVAGHSTIKEFLMPAMTNFNYMHPTIKFSISTFHSSVSIQLLKEGKVDLVFLSMNNVCEEYSNIMIEKFMELDTIFVVKNDLKLNIPKKIKLLDLNKYPVIALPNNSFCRRWLDNYFEDHNLIFNPTYELSNGWLIEEYVSRCSGLGILSKQHIISKLNSKEFIEIESDVKLPKNVLGYAYRKDSVNYQIIKEFISIIKKMNNID